MNDEIQLISDGDGLALIGDSAAVERFLAAENLSSKDLGLQRLRSTIGLGARVAQASADVAANSGRWVKLTEESAQAVKKYGLMTSSKTGLSMGVIQAKGQAAGIKGIVQFASVPGSFLTPALLANAAGLMAQQSMQQSIDEIADYLATIDAKIDDILRGQTNATLAEMIGVDFVIEDAMAMREQLGRVDDLTWSKVQGASETIARTQAYALLQLDTLAQKMEGKIKLGDFATTSKEAESKVPEWLAVIARCFQLQDALTVLELDRVLDSSPENVDQHRLGLMKAREKRLARIAQSTDRLLGRMDTAISTANSKMLLHPNTSRAVVASSAHVAVGVVNLYGRLGIEVDRESLETRRWLDAATDARDRVLEMGGAGVDVVKVISSGARDRAVVVTDKVSSGISKHVERLRRHEEIPGDDDPGEH